jgi:hypothetical protein
LSPSLHTTGSHLSPLPDASCTSDSESPSAAVLDLPPQAVAWYPDAPSTRPSPGKASVGNKRARAWGPRNLNGRLRSSSSCKLRGRGLLIGAGESPGGVACAHLVSLSPRASSRPVHVPVAGRWLSHVAPPEKRTGGNFKLPFLRAPSSIIVAPSLKEQFHYFDAFPVSGSPHDSTSDTQTSTLTFILIDIENALFETEHKRGSPLNRNRC